MTFDRGAVAWRWATLTFALLGAGCATLREPQLGNLESGPSAVRQCAGWFRDLDEAVDRAGAREAGAYRIPGFPYLRADRFAASFREQARDNDAAFSAWLLRLRRADAAGRRAEIRNLPAREVPAAADGGEAAAILTERCAAELARHDLRDTPARAQLIERSGVPDEYRDWQRAAGLYPLLAYPFAQGIARWHEEATAAFRATRAAARSPGIAVTRYAPSAAGGLSRDAVAALLARARAHPLRVPEFSEPELERLLSTYAPVFELEIGGAYDRPGALTWDREGRLAVDASKPVVYGRLAYTRNGEDTLAQLVYTLWFPERPASGALDILAGKLDGVVFRVTLAADGEPVLFDSMHPCGCYHMFFPTPRAQALPAPGKMTEWAFVPAAVPSLPDGARMRLRVATRTHYLLDVAPDMGGPADATYAFEDEESLRSLPLPGGGYRSVYAPSGLIEGTDRGERALFWPMGIPSAGAMRQWGKHATGFLGKRHFDDADLVERRFKIAPPPAGPVSAGDGPNR